MRLIRSEAEAEEEVTCKKCGGTDFITWGKKTTCRPCRNAWSRAWRAKHPESARAMVKKSKEKAGPRALKDSFLKYKYGISMNEFEALLVSQGGKCAVCQVSFDTMKTPRQGPIVDHDHETGAVRGLLCQYCNIGVATLDRGADWLASASTYVALGRAARHDLTVQTYDWDGTPTQMDGCNDKR